VNVKEQKDSKSPPQVNVKDSRSKTLSVVPKNKDGEKKAEEKKRGGSALGFFKKTKSSEKSALSKPKATQNEVKAADVQQPIEKQGNEQSESEGKPPSQAMTAQLVAELKQKNVAGQEKTTSVPEGIAEKPKPKPRSAVVPMVPQGVLAEMKDKQEARKNTASAKPSPPVRPKPVSCQSSEN
jgi:hypothetical protein